MSGHDVDYKDLRMLVVEDNPVNQKVIKAMLDHFGVSVDIADNGLIALEKSKKTKYDLIIMDCQMPEMNGYDATRLIRQFDEAESQTKPDVTIVAMTANTSDTDQKACFDAGMDDFVAKPIELEMIDNLLRKWHGGN